MQQIDMTVNKLPAPTWNRLRLNKAEIGGVSAPDGACEAEVELENVRTELSDAAKMNAVATGMGADMNLLAALAGAEQAALCFAAADEGARSTLAFNFHYEDGKRHFNRIDIRAAAGSDITVFMTYASGREAGGMAALQTRIVAEAGAKVRLVQVQLLGREFLHLNDVGCLLAEGARFEALQLQLGGKELYNGVLASLQGEGAAFDAAVGYCCRGSQRLDMNFVADHYGKKTVSNILAGGVLQDSAFKLFRGTIDFKNGAAGAAGSESEDVLLLNEGVVNQSIPLILCSEEDVAGNHGASIGRLDDDLLFYLTSRGLSESTAVQMMARAKIDALCRRIGDARIEAAAAKYLEGEMTDGE